MAYVISKVPIHAFLLFDLGKIWVYSDHPRM